MGFPSPGRRGAAEASAGGEGKADEWETKCPALKRERFDLKGEVVALHMQTLAVWMDQLPFVLS